jgi:TPR repeat protein
MKKLIRICLLSGLIFSSGAMAQSKSDIPQEIKTYSPGLLFDQTKRNAIKDYSKESPLPSSKYVNEDLSEDQLRELYDEKEYKDAILGILALARKGNAWAQETVGLMYRNSQGVKKDDKLALQWLLQAAKKGRPLAQHHLGFMYYSGEGDYKDYLKAAMFLELAHRNYQNAPEKERAAQDRDNVMVRLSKIERTRAEEMVDNFLRDNPAITVDETAEQNKPTE